METMAIVCRFVLAVAAVALVMSAVAEALPARPVGYYTFDGEKLRPLSTAQRRSDEPGADEDDDDEEDDDGRPSGLAALAGNLGINWPKPTIKLPSLENTRQRTAAFLSSLVDRGDSDGDDAGQSDKAPSGITSEHLLPDYLTHQEFIKPQLQAAGFSGGRIIAGPFPVPLSALPKLPARSIPSGPLTHIPPVAPPAKVKVAKPQASKLLKPPPLPATTTTPTPAQTTTTIAASPIAFATTTPQPPPIPVAPTVRPFSYKPVQFPAVKVAAAAAATGRPAPTTQAPKKLIYPIPTSGPVHWYAAHSSGPEKPVSVLGVPTYSHPATFESSIGGTRLSYGGWTPMYSPSYASVSVQQEPDELRAPAKYKPQDAVTEKNVLVQTEAPQTLDAAAADNDDDAYDAQAADQVAEASSPSESIVKAPDSSSLPRIVVGAGSVGSTAAAALTSEAESDGEKKRSSSVSVTASSRRTVRKRKAKQVRPARRVVGPVALNAESGRAEPAPAPDQEVAASEPVAPQSSPAPVADDAAARGAPWPSADDWSLGQVQGRSLTGFWVPAVEVSDLTEALSW